MGLSETAHASSELLNDARYWGDWKRPDWLKTGPGRRETQNCRDSAFMGTIESLFWHENLV